jgi:hypothetical protein
LVFDPIHAGPSAPTDNQFVDLIAQAIGDMFHEWLAVQQGCCLVCAKARSLAASDDRT